MADAKEQEPSIEEILESIRQIISDEPEDEAEDQPEAEAAPEPEPEPEAEEDEDEDVLELTDVVNEGDDASEDDDAFVVEAPAEDDDEDEDEDDEPKTHIELRDREGEELDEDQLVSDATDEAATAMMAKLNENLHIERDRPDPISTATGVTLEEIVREMLRPMLKDWLDRRLPGIVERLVEKELKRMSRHARDDD